MNGSMEIQAAMVRQIGRHHYGWCWRIWSWFQSDAKVNQWMIDHDWEWQLDMMGYHHWVGHGKSYSAFLWAIWELRK